MQLRRFVLSQPAEALLLDDGANLGESFLDHVLGHRATFARKLAQQMRNLVHIPVEQIEPITTLFTKQFAEYFGLFAAAVEHWIGGTRFSRVGASSSDQASFPDGYCLFYYPCSWAGSILPFTGQSEKSGGSSPGGHG